MKIVLPSATTQSSTQCSQNHHSIGHATKLQFTLVAIAGTTLLVLSLSQITAIHGSGTCRSHIDGLVQERRNSTANALELHLSCTNPSILRCPIFKQVSRLDNMTGDLDQGPQRQAQKKFNIFFKEISRITSQISKTILNIRNGKKCNRWSASSSHPLRATLASKT